MAVKQGLSERDLTIIRLWESGMTGRDIANELGTTRNAVLGKLRRLRLDGHVSYKMNAKVDLKKATPKKIKEAKSFNLNRKSIRGVQPPMPLPKPRPIKHEPIKFMDLTPFSCRYVVNEGHASTFLFCGKPKTGRAYCDDHAKICYVPSKYKGEAA
jgi:GcrA cell cycle regulator